MKKRKLAVVTAFMDDPDILLLDEPTSGLDPVMQEIFIDFIREEKKNGKTILLSSHIFNEVEAVCDRIAIIKDGRHYYISSRPLTADELLHHARMEWAVESMYWILDVHFEEDWCLIEDKVLQQHLNMFRKAAINLIKLFKSRTKSKKAISKIMLDCLIDSSSILRVIGQN